MVLVVSQIHTYYRVILFAGPFSLPIFSTEKENDLQPTEKIVTQMALFVVCKSHFISVLTNLEEELK